MTLTITEVDGFALAMLFILALSFGFVLMILVVMLRSGRRARKEVDDLIDEVSEDPPKELPAGKPPAKKEPRQPWEKPEDWWKP